MLMRVIATLALKGGTGKTTVVANLGFALRDKRYKVGLLDIDITSSTLPRALGLKTPPRVETDPKRSKLLPSKVMGLEVFSLSSHFGTGAVLWEDGEMGTNIDGEFVPFKGTGRKELVKQMLRDVSFSADNDYLLLDLPPSSGGEVLSLWENLPEFYGAILVCQPTSMSMEGMERTLDMIKTKKLPVIGLVSNMAGVVCPECHHEFSPFLNTVDLKEFCARTKIPFLISIPLTNDQEKLKNCFRELATIVERTTPVKLWELSVFEKLSLKMEMLVGKKALGHRR